MMGKLEEIKSRKRKFGFKSESIYPENFIFLGSVMSFLSLMPPQEYLAEMAGGSFGSNCGFRLYTDNETLANDIRTKFC